VRAPRFSLRSNEASLGAESSNRSVERRGTRGAQVSGAFLWTALLGWSPWSLWGSPCPRWR